MRPLSRTLLALMVAVSSVAAAKVGVLDDARAATLLIPFVEVDLASPTGRSTVVEVRAASPSSVLSHVTLWTDQGVPVFGFDLYLTGFDVQAFDVRDVLNGTLPVTASDGQDPTDTISPQGSNSQDINFASCTGVLPPPAPSAQLMSAVRDAMTGLPSSALQGQCGGRALGDNVARGFITIDTTNQCTTLHPNAPGYFVAGGAGVAANRMELTGHFKLVDPTAKTTRAFSAAHLETTAAPGYVGATGYTFYSRLIGSTADGREPLGNAWNVPFRQGASVISWRDVNWPAATWACSGTGPASVGQDSLFLFDQQERAVDASNLTPFGAMSNRVAIGSDALPDTSRGGFVAFLGSLGEAQPRQSWFGTMETAEGGVFASGVVGTQLDNVAARVNLPNNANPVSSDASWSFMGAADRAPAATLLLPYFEVDLDDANRSETVVRITNVSASAMLVNATLWTDLGVPTMRFPVYLTGFDQAEFNLRLLFSQGLGHVTASAGQDSGNRISPQGPFSQDINFASCTGQLPLSRLTAATVTGLQNAHLGKASTTLGGKCGATDRGDRVARGYITFDSVNSCAPIFPGDPTASNTLDARNNLTGDWSIISRRDRTQYSEALVAVSARQQSGSGGHSFYSRINGHGFDGREPLQALWEVPFDDTGTGKTSFVVWREPGAVAAFTCGATPTGQPGDVLSAAVFDEQEEVTSLPADAFSKVSTFIAAGAGGLAVPHSKGVLQLDLNGGTAGNVSPRGGFVMALRRDATGGTGWVQNSHPLLDENVFATPPVPSNLIEATMLEGFVTRVPSGTATFVVRARQAPTAPVAVTMSSSSVSLSPASVVLTAANYATGVTVVATATSGNFYPEARVDFGVASSTDAAFQGFTTNSLAIHSSSR